MSPDSDQASGSRNSLRARVPQNPIIQVASKALEKFIVKAFGELQARLPRAPCGPGLTANGPNLQLRLLTDFMIRQLRESVSRRLGTTTAAGPRARSRGARRAPCSSGRRAAEPEPGRQQSARMATRLGSSDPDPEQNPALARRAPRRSLRPPSSASIYTKRCPPGGIRRSTRSLGSGPRFSRP